MKINILLIAIFFSACGTNVSIEQLENKKEQPDNNLGQSNQDTNQTENLSEKENTEATTTKEVETISAMRMTLVWASDPGKVIHEKKYGFDEAGRTIWSSYNNVNNPEHSYTSEYEYDLEGRLIREIRDGLEFMRVEWNGPLVEVFNKNQDKIFEYQLNDQGLPVSKQRGMQNGHRIEETYEYDSEMNLITVLTGGEETRGYRAYDTDILNPLYKLKSIFPLGGWGTSEMSKNIHQEEWVYVENDGGEEQLVEDDVSYEFDEHERVIAITDGLSVIYKVMIDYDMAD